MGKTYSVDGLNVEGSSIITVVGESALVDGAWHWVSEDGKEWWPAKRDAQAMGGWTNDDTWEDFPPRVKFAARIQPPRPMSDGPRMAVFDCGEVVRRIHYATEFTSKLVADPRSVQVIGSEVRAALLEGKNVFVSLVDPATLPSPSPTPAA